MNRKDENKKSMATIESAVDRAPDSNTDTDFNTTHPSHRVVLAHGGGGQLTSDLIDELIMPRLSNPTLNALDDAAQLKIGDERVVFTTDSYVVQPITFPGGDIGRLAVSGTVNDLAVSGAIPRHLSIGLILEEGLPLDELRQVIDSIAATAEEAGVTVVTGDTKVVARGQADKIYINSAGVGALHPKAALDLNRIQPGDAVLISGTIADHGLAVMLQREEAFGIQSELRSDATPLGKLIVSLLDELSDDVVFMRDPTRGGLAGVVSDLAEETGLHLRLDEARIPIRPETHYAAEVLGLDPLDVANEGKVVIVVRHHRVDDALRLLHANPHARNAACIGEFVNERDGLCEIITDVGGRRIIQKPYGEELPRIC